MPTDIGALLKTAFNKIRRHPMVVGLFVARWLIFAFFVTANVVYFGYVHSGATSKILSDDFVKVEDAQSDLLSGLVQFQEAIVDPQTRVDLPSSLGNIRNNAQEMLAALGSLRAPTSRIDTARRDYRSSLETLIGTANKIERQGTQDMGLELYESMQQAANAAGAFRAEVEDFQGGAWPQIFGAIF